MLGAAWGHHIAATGHRDAARRGPPPAPAPNFAATPALPSSRPGSSASWRPAWLPLTTQTGSQAIAGSWRACTPWPASTSASRPGTKRPPQAAAAAAGRHMRHQAQCQPRLQHRMHTAPARLLVQLPQLSPRRQLPARWRRSPCSISPRSACGTWSCCRWPGSTRCRRPTPRASWASGQPRAAADGLLLLITRDAAVRLACRRRLPWLLPSQRPSPLWPCSRRCPLMHAKHTLCCSPALFSLAGAARCRPFLSCCAERPPKAFTHRCAAATPAAAVFPAALATVLSACQPATTLPLAPTAAAGRRFWRAAPAPLRRRQPPGSAERPAHGCACGPCGALAAQAALILASHSSLLLPSIRSWSGQAPAAPGGPAARAAGSGGSRGSVRGEPVAAVAG